MQTSVSLDRPIGRAGLIADNRSLEHIRSRICRGDVKAGCAVFRIPSWGQPGTSQADPGSVYQSPTGGNAADVDAILAGGGSTAGIQTLLAANFNGVVGSAVMYPGRLITLVLSNHADWDATTAVLTGKDQYGNTVTENLTIPNAGNTTLTSTNLYSQVVSLVIPAQSGTGGTFTVGIAALDSSITIADFQGVAVFDESLEPNTIPSQNQTAEYHDYDTVSVMKKGAIWVTTEDACSFGEPVYVRTLPGAGGTQIGAFRSDADSATAILVTGAEWGKDSTAGNLNVLEMY
jgi:hypothetical protein